MWVTRLSVLFCYANDCVSMYVGHKLPVLRDYANEYVRMYVDHKAACAM